MAADHRRVTGKQMTAEKIAGLAAQGDTECTATLEHYCDRLARSLAGVVNILDPDVIVLGGGLSHIAALYADVPALWGEHIFSTGVDTQLLPPKHGDASGVRGAAWLWEET